jgi:hypothetical protein
VYQRVASAVHAAGTAIDRASTAKTIPAETSSAAEASSAADASSRLVIWCDPEHTDIKQVASVLADVFHKRTYCRPTLRAKLAGMVALYGRAHARVDPHQAERDAVHQYITTTYRLSNDDAHRMRASILYRLVSGAVSLSCAVRGGSGSGSGSGSDIAGLTRRVAGYLLDLGLTKKRFADGYFYFGIEAIIPLPHLECGSGSGVDLLQPTKVHGQSKSKSGSGSGSGGSGVSDGRDRWASERHQVAAAVEASCAQTSCAKQQHARYSGSATDLDAIMAWRDAERVA